MGRRTKTTTEILGGGLLEMLLRHGSTYLFGSGLLVATGLLLMPLNTRLFSRAEYGAIATVNAANGLLLVFVGLQLHAAYLRLYVDHRDDPARLRTLTSTLWWATAGLAAPAIPVALLVARLLPVPAEVAGVLGIAFLAPAFHQLARLSIVHLQQNHRAALQRGLALLSVLVHAAVMVLLVAGFGLGLRGKFVGVACGAGVLALAGGVVLRRAGLLGLELSGSMLRSSLAYSLPLLPGLAAAWVTNLSDRILLARLESFEAAGIYHAGYLVGRVVAMLGQAILLVYFPVMLARLDRDPDGARSEIASFLPPFLLALGWVSVAVGLFASEVLSLLAPEGYGPAAAVVPVILAAHVLRAVASLFHYVLVFEKRTLLLGAGLAIEALVNLGLNLLLIPSYGMIAAAWATLAAMAVHTAWVLAWSRRYVPARLAGGRVALALLSLGVVAAIGLLAGRIAGAAWLSAVAKGLVLVASLPALWRLFGPRRAGSGRASRSGAT